MDVATLAYTDREGGITAIYKAIRLQVTQNHWSYTEKIDAKRVVKANKSTSDTNKRKRHNFFNRNAYKAGTCRDILNILFGNFALHFFIYRVSH